MLTLFAKLLQALNSENSTRQIALAVALAFILGLSPLVSVQALTIIFIVLFIKVHLASFILAAGVFSGIGYVFNSPINSVGDYLLTAQGLTPIFESLYQFDLFKLAQLHHTFNLGGLMLGMILAIPLYFVCNTLIEKYREHIQAYLEKLSIVKALKATKVYRLYVSLTPQGTL